MGQGTERERSPGVWELRVDVGTDPITGRRVQKSRTFRGTGVRARRDAMRKLQADADRIRESWAELTVDTGDDWTVRQLLERWWWHNAGTWSPKTAYDHGRVVESELLNPERGALADVLVPTLRTIDIDAAYQRMLGAGSKPSMIEKAHRVLRGALTQAVTWEQIARNPAVGAKIPKRHVAKVREVDVSRLKGLLAALVARAADDPDFDVAVRLSLFAGQRRGSTDGLQWRDVVWGDVDGAGAELRFTRRVLVVPGSPMHVLPGNKTGRVVRVAIDPITVERLKVYRRLKQERALAAGVGRLAESTFVLSRDAAGLVPWLPDTFTKQWRRLADSHGLPDVRLHDLRHEMISQLIGGGIDAAAVSERAGHSTKTITLDIYSHALPANDAASAAHLSQVFDTPS